MIGLRRRPSRELLKKYAEGRRLMRHGDGADEWFGMRFAKDAADALEAAGFDTAGKRLKACPSCGSKGRSHLVVNAENDGELRVPSYYTCTQRLLVPDPAEVERRHDDWHWGKPCPFTRPIGCEYWRRQARITVENLLDEVS